MARGYDARAVYSSKCTMVKRTSKSEKRDSKSDEIESSQQQRHRLTTLGRESHVSQSGLHKLVAAFAQDGMPVHANRKVQYKARKERCSEHTPYGKLVESFDLPCKKGTLTIGVQNPMAMIYRTCSVVPSFAALMRAKLAVNPLPWRIIIYEDGITPADPLQGHDVRKMDAIYWSFAEFGYEHLSNEDLWFTLATIRENRVMMFQGACRMCCGCCCAGSFSTSKGTTSSNTA